jgi:hypothetical protein
MRISPDDQDGPPRLSVLSVPKGNRHQAWQIVSNLADLDLYSRRFASALRLSDHIEELLEPIEVALPSVTAEAGRYPLTEAKMSAMHTLIERRNELSSWVGIAIRDAIFTIDHFEFILATIQSDLFKCPTWYQLADAKKLGMAKKLFKKHFPQFPQIRHAIGHESERTATDSKIEEHALSGVHKHEFFTSEEGAENNSISMISGRTIALNWQNKIVSFELTKQTLEHLHEIKRMVYDAVRPASEALRGVDLGD